MLWCGFSSLLLACQRVLDHHDATFADAGLVGLWTKADSVTYFDDLTIEGLE
jgi:hypothetical protein